jgi:hypothetical protein
MLQKNPFPDEIVWYSAKIIKPISFSYTNSTIYHNPSLRNTIVWYTKFSVSQNLNENTEWFVITKRKKGYCIFDIFTSTRGKEYFQSTDFDILDVYLKEEFEKIMIHFYQNYQNRNKDSGFFNYRKHKADFGYKMMHLNGTIV